jgi:micrococcal nuclease
MRVDDTRFETYLTPRSIALAALLLIAAAPPEHAKIRYVTDGDTFRLTSGERIRIAGIDAPETHADQAKCHAELALGDTAAARARALLDGRTVGIERVGRSYNRTVARVTLDGRDVATMFVADGIARWWPHHTPKPDWWGDTLDRPHAHARSDRRR